MPSISVLLPVYNGRRYLAAAITSVLEQSHRDFELIVIDDGSTDGSASVMDRFAANDARIRVIRRPNTGIVGALNDGLKAATGEFIARMDGDDVAEPTRFAEQIAYLRAHPDCVAVGSATWLIDAGGAVIDRYVPPLLNTDIEAQLLEGNGGALIHPSLMVRRAAIESVGRYRPEFNRAEDLDLFLRLARIGHLANVPLPLLRYRIHLGSTNFVHRENQLALCRQIVAAARKERGLPPAATTGLTEAPADLSALVRHRGWVVTALRWGRRRTAIKHALLGLKAAPSALASWKYLRFALMAPTEPKQ